MTVWQEFPLRPQGRPWTGINTRSGKLDDGTGQMLDDSVGVIINTGDRLEKRKGLIRGLDERFTGTVCGLHAYTDECGREWLLVADEGGFSIRQPFAIPSFPNSDAYPSDSFQIDGPVSITTWQNTGGYAQLDGSLILGSGDLDPGDLLWFKDATNFSYKSDFEWTLFGNSTVAAVIKSGTTARIEGRLILDGTEVIANLVWIDEAGMETLLGTLDLAGVLNGTATLSYNRNTASNVYTATFTVTPEDASEIVLQDFTVITALTDADFGQTTALRLERDDSAGLPTVLSIQGAPL